MEPLIELQGVGRDYQTGKQVVRALCDLDLIIEHGEGYHTLLAGMARIDGTVGQHLTTGEPVGVMGQGEGKPLLYVELRHNGQPVNPLPWLTARKAKVSG